MDELLTRQMPHSTEAEQSVLGCMFIDEKCIPEVVTALKPEDFYLRQNREIYETIYRMVELSASVDLVTVLEQMRQNGTFKDSTLGYVQQLMEITPTSANLKEYISIVRDKALLRRVAEAAGEVTGMVQTGEGTGAQVLDAAEQKIYAIRQGRATRGLEHISLAIQNVYDRLGELAASGNEIPGLSTGLSDLDRRMTGLNPSDLIILAARPGMGKTSMALNMALHAGKTSGKAIVIFSLEMSKEQLAMRLISSEFFVDSKKLLTGQGLTMDDWKKIGAASAALSKTQILLDDNPSLTAKNWSTINPRTMNQGLSELLRP